MGVTPVYRACFRPESALRETGWMESVRRNEVVNAQGEPLPWMTYSLIYFLEPRLHHDFCVFEYGTGNSTLWFAPKVQSIISLEHDRKWYSRVMSRSPGNVEQLYVEISDPRSYGELSFGDGAEDNDYTRMISRWVGTFDLIIIDGIYRCACIVRAVNSLKPTGVLLVDNTNEKRFEPARRNLRAQGFRELPFWGMVPLQNWTSCSSIFYRPQNCLDL